MDTNSEMYIASKYRYIKTALTSKILTNLINKNNFSYNKDNTKDLNRDNNNSKIDNCNFDKSKENNKQILKLNDKEKELQKEKKKLEAEERKRQKEEKIKKMQELCAPGEKAMKKKQFEVKAKIIDSTPVGEKKDMSKPMLDSYEPYAVESAWDAWWTKKKFFHVSSEEALKYPEEKRYTMLLPPPNVTGQLHLGHTLMSTIEDAIIRWKKMNGYCALWIPGIDHAGISCQTVVEKKILKEEKKLRTDFTRDEFLKRVWDWKKDYGNRILEQFKRIGVSFDWDRMYFTMDEQRSKAVQHAFIDLFERGILYRDKRIVHWCCTLKTAISDVELEDLEINGIEKIKVPGYDKEVEFGALIDFSYKLKSDTSKEIIISTTRIETMLADVAVAVHSKDPRYKDYVGQKLIHPFFPDRDITIITDDDLVDMEFGTGAVKITPGHDPNDFECGKRHNLNMILVIDDMGYINNNGGKLFSGLKRYNCRLKIQEELKKLGQLKGKKPNKMVVQICSKTGDIIEPMVKPQWWINCKEVAARGVEDVKSNKLKIVPEFQKVTWFSFLENIRDWCISRQLWWGHRCPAYLIKIENVLDNPETHNNNHWVAARSEEEAIIKAAKKFNISNENIKKISVTQDEDVLDTWFSSALLPLSLAGWPEENHKDFDLFFPSNILETGHDIIFFWVARMVFFSYMFKDKLPFNTIYLHPIVRDAQGRKMSKSLGNVIDPLEVIDGISLENMLSNLKLGNLNEKEIKRCEIEKKKEYPKGIPECGSDALRIGLMSYMVQGRNINLDVQRVIGYRNFGKKLWNASNYFLKFGLEYTKDISSKSDIKDYIFKPNIDMLFKNQDKLNFINKWILNKLGKTIINFNKSFENYLFGDAVNSIYSFWIDYFCDVYIEAVKSIFKSNKEQEKEQTRNVMFFCLIEALKILHPIAPFITEELYQRLNYEVYSRINSSKELKNLNSICIEKFPTESSFINDDIDYLGTINGELVHKILGITSLFSIRENLNTKECKNNKDDDNEKQKKPNKPKLKIYINSQDKLIEEFINTERVIIATLSKIDSIKIIKSCKELEIKNYVKVIFNENIDFYVDLSNFNVDLIKNKTRVQNELKDKLKAKSDLQMKMSISGYEINASKEVQLSNMQKLKKIDIEIDKLQNNLKEI